MRRILKTMAPLGLAVMLMAADDPHVRVLDDFKTKKDWTSGTVTLNYDSTDRLYHVGLWSTPCKPDVTFSVENGKGIFNFPGLETWIPEGFQYHYHLSSPGYLGLYEFEGETYLAVKVENRCSEAVSLTFRAFDEIGYLYGSENTPESALVLLNTSPASLTLLPHSHSVYRVKLSRPGINQKEYHDIDYHNWIKTIAFEAHRTIAPSKEHPTARCTLAFDYIRLEDRYVGK